MCVFVCLCVFVCFVCVFVRILCVCFACFCCVFVVCVSAKFVLCSSHSRDGWFVRALHAGGKMERGITEGSVGFYQVFPAPVLRCFGDAVLPIAPLWAGCSMYSSIATGLLLLSLDVSFALSCFLFSGGGL